MFPFGVNVIISGILITLTIIFSFCAIIYMIKEGVEKSTKLSAFASLFAAVCTFLSLINFEIPSPVISFTNNEVETNNNSIEIIISSSEGDPFITTYYSLDGSDPKNGTKYEKGIDISQSTNVSARNKFFWWWSEKAEGEYKFENNSTDNESSKSSSRSPILPETFRILPLDDDEKFIQMDTNVITLNVRERPYTDFGSSIITQISYEEKYKLIDKVINDKNEIWYKIVIDEKRNGFVKSEFVEIIR